MSRWILWFRVLAAAGMLCLGSAFAAGNEGGEQGPLDLNTASAKDIARVMYGVGLRKAQTIVEYREKNGPFKELSDLVKVRGVSHRILERNMERIRVSDHGD